MSTSRLKSIVIAVLLLINLFFLADIIGGRISGAAERSREIRSLQTVMAASGIVLSDSAVSDVTALDAYLTSQDAFAEAVIARAILGDCEPVQTDRGQEYTGPRGTAFFFTSGGFEITLTELFSPSDSTPERAAKKLLKSMNIDATEPVLTTYGNTDVVIALCTWRGSQIFNCTVTFEFKDGALLRVFGYRPSGVLESQESGHISFSTAMLGFLRYEREQELRSTVITSIDTGYRMNVGAFGDGMLIPGWLIVTDTGAFFANASTGEIERNDN